MGTKSRVRKRNGKPVKYQPKPKGISKTKMKKILEMIQEQQKILNTEKDISTEDVIESIESESIESGTNIEESHTTTINDPENTEESR